MEGFGDWCDFFSSFLRLVFADITYWSEAIDVKYSHVPLKDGDMFWDMHS